MGCCQMRDMSKGLYFVYTVRLAHLCSSVTLRYICPGLSFGFRKMSEQSCSNNHKTCYKWPTDTWERTVLWWYATEIRNDCLHSIILALYNWVGGKKKTPWYWLWGGAIFFWGIKLKFGGKHWWLTVSVHAFLFYSHTSNNWEHINQFWSMRYNHKSHGGSPGKTFWN